MIRNLVNVFNEINFAVDRGIMFVIYVRNKSYIGGHVFVELYRVLDP